MIHTVTIYTDRFKVNSQNKLVVVPPGNVFIYFASGAGSNAVELESGKWIQPQFDAPIYWDVNPVAMTIKNSYLSP